MKHDLKTWPHPFSASWAEAKPFEIRKDDREFHVYDEVVLQEWDPDSKEYTGREIEGYIEYISRFEQKPGYVVFTVVQTGRSEA